MLKNLYKNILDNTVMTCKTYINMYSKKLHSYLDNIDSTITILSF